MKEKMKITITLFDDIIDINKMLASLAKTPSILQGGYPTNENA